MSQNTKPSSVTFCILIIYYNYFVLKLNFSVIFFSVPHQFYDNDPCFLSKIGGTFQEECKAELFKSSLRLLSSYGLTLMVGVCHFVSYLPSLKTFFHSHTSSTLVGILLFSKGSSNQHNLEYVTVVQNQTVLVPKIIQLPSDSGNFALALYNHNCLTSQG